MVCYVNSDVRIVCNASIVGKASIVRSVISVSNVTSNVSSVYTICINGCQFKILLYAFKLAQLTSFESKNSFELSTQKQG